eukprot:2561777-Alexandrium_andersonii.AAC.1
MCIRDRAPPPLWAPAPWMREPSQAVWAARPSGATSTGLRAPCATRTHGHQGYGLEGASLQLPHSGGPQVMVVLAGSDAREAQPHGAALLQLAFCITFRCYPLHALLDRAVRLFSHFACPLVDVPRPAAGMGIP